METGTSNGGTSEHRPTRLPLRRNLGIERGLAIARRLQFQLAEVALQDLGGFSIARVAPLVARRVIFRLLKVTAKDFRN
jgi:hypothetical protein